MVLIMYSHTRRERSLIRTLTVATLTAGLLAVLASPAAATSQYWYPVPKPLPKTFACLPSKENPPGFSHQSCLHFTNGNVEGAYIVYNGIRGRSQTLAAKITMWGWGTWGQFHPETTCLTSAIAYRQQRVCYGNPVSYITADTSYQADGQLILNGVPVDPVDWSPVRP